MRETFRNLSNLFYFVKISKKKINFLLLFKNFNANMIFLQIFIICFVKIAIYNIKMNGKICW